VRGQGAGLRLIRRAAVLGRPVTHSLSPLLHRAAYAALGLTGWRYDALDCDEARLPGLVAGLGDAWAGLSVTMPCKRVALATAGAASDLAVAVGAANTLLHRDGGWYADNTDVAGIASTLREARVGSIDRAVVLGAGGTAQAALAALADLGARTPTVLVRDPARSAALLATARRIGSSPRLQQWPDALSPDWDVLISTVPAGAADRFASGPWPRDGVLLDVLYADWPTPLARAATAAGVACVVGGHEVLLHQAAAQVALMTDQPAPLAAMRAALTAARLHGH